MRLDHELILNLWKRGTPTDRIAFECGTIYVASIAGIVSKHRALGDPRAVNRPKGEAFKGANSGLKMFRNRMRLKKFAKKLSDPSELSSLIANYTGSITKCPLGFHAGHRPKCLASIGL